MYDSNMVYQTLSSLPSFTYVIMGNIILLFIIELIVQNLPKPHHIMAESKVILNKRKSFVKIVKCLVILEIAIVMGLFFAVIALRIMNQANSKDQTLRVRISLMVASLYTITFFLLMSSTLYLVCSVFNRYQKSFKHEKKQVSSFLQTNHTF